MQTVGGGMQFVWGIGAVDRWVVGGGIGAVSPLRRFAPALPEGEPRVRWALMDGALNSGLWSCFRFAHSSCLSLRERYLPKGGERDVQTVGGGMQFVRGIGAVGIDDLFEANCLD